MKTSPNNRLLSAIAVLTAALLAVYGCGGGGDNSTAPATTATPTACSAPPLTTEYSEAVLFKGENADGVATNCALRAGDSSAGQLAVVTCRNRNAYAGFGGRVRTAISADIEFVFVDENEDGTFDDSEIEDGLSASASVTVDGDILLTNNGRTLALTDFVFDDLFFDGFVEASCVQAADRSLKAGAPEDAAVQDEQNMLSLHGAVGEIVSDGSDDSDVTESEIEDITTRLDEFGTGESPR